MQSHSCRLVLEHEVLGVTDDLGRDGQLLVGRLVHENIGVAILVEVLHVATINFSRLNLDVGVESAINNFPAQHVLELGTHDGVALTRFVVLEPDDRPQLAVEVENGAVLDVIGGCLLYTSPSPRDGLLSRMPSSA